MYKTRIELDSWDKWGIGLYRYFLLANGLIFLDWNRVLIWHFKYSISKCPLDPHEGFTQDTLAGGTKVTPNHPSHPPPTRLHLYFIHLRYVQRPLTFAFDTYSFLPYF